MLWNLPTFSSQETCGIEDTLASTGDSETHDSEVLAEESGWSTSVKTSLVWQALADKSDILDAIYLHVLRSFVIPPTWFIPMRLQNLNFQPPSSIWNLQRKLDFLMIKATDFQSTQTCFPSLLIQRIRTQNVDVQSTNDNLSHDNFGLTYLALQINHASCWQHIVTCSLQDRNADFITVNNLLVRQPPLCNDVTCGSTVHMISSTRWDSCSATGVSFLEVPDSSSFTHMVICSWICLTDPPALGSASGSGWSSPWSSSSHSVKTT